MPHPIQPVDAGSSSDWAPVRLATTVNIAILAGGAPNVADGIPVNVNDRILVRAQGALTTNGPYVVQVVGGGANGTWVRAPDADQSSEFTDGKTVTVGEGATLADSEWQLTTDAPIVLGVSNIVFMEISPATVLTGWTRDVGPPATVRLTAAAVQVASGTASPVAGRKTTILTTGANQGIRVTTTAAGDNVLEALLSGEANARLQILGTGQISAGPGAGIALDTTLYRFAAGEWAMNGSLAVLGAGIGIGTAGVIGPGVIRIHAAFAPSAIYLNNFMLDGFGVVEPNARTVVTDTGFLAGPGATPLDLRLYRSGVSEFTFDNDAAGGQCTVLVSGVERITADNATNAANTDILTLVHTTTGVPGAGLGTGILLRGENATPATVDMAAIRASFTNVGAGAEASVLDLYTRTAGGVITARWRVDAVGDYLPFADATYGLGSSSLRLRDATSNLWRVYAGLGEINPTAQLSSTTLALGLNSADNLKTRIYCSASKTLTLDDGSAGDLTLLDVRGVEAVTADNATNAGNTDVLTVVHTTTGVPGNGIGTGVLFRSENSTPATVDVAAIRASLTNAGAGVEASAINFWTRTAGGVLNSRWRMNDVGNLDPSLDSAYGIGTSSLRIATVVANTYQVFAGIGAANPTLQLTTATVGFGPGAGAGLDTRISRTALKTLTVDDNAAGVMTLDVIGTTVTDARVLHTTFVNDAIYTMDSGATPDDFIGVLIVANDRVITMVAAVDGRRVILCNTAIFSVIAKAAIFTCAGAETFNTATGANATYSLTGAQSITVVGRTGVGWYVV